ncbi:MAG TPA: hypothetical protein P5250_01610 [Bacteroidales bacterium]|nr:hypothetical protein [Bacteroidales bacterium]
MENKFIEILPFIGLSNLEFGITLEEVEKLLGPPDQSETLEELEDENEDDFNTLMWHYEQPEFTLFFESDEDDAKILTCIETSNTNSTLFGKKIFDMTEEEIIKLMNDNGFENIEIEDETWGEKRISFTDAIIDFYFENNELTSVSWGISEEDDDENDNYYNN